MKIERSRNAGRNLFFGVLLKLHQILIPFLMRTLMIYEMGMEYAGLNHLFVSIFQFLNLAELGIGAALTCSMYRPIARDNREEICALLKLYRSCFAAIGGAVLGLGLLCMPLLPHLIRGQVPRDLNLYWLYGLYLGNTVLSYWLFSYKKSLLYAHQRNDISSKVMLLTQSVQYVLQILVLTVLHNYYLYLLSAMAGQILNNLISAAVADRMYPRYRPAGKLSAESLRQVVQKVRGLVTNKIGGVVLRSADSLVISAFLGLTVLAVYQNYYFILTAVMGVLSIACESCLAGIGNSLVTENGEKNYFDFKTLTFLFCWVSSVCCSCFLVLYQPFIALWVGEQYLMEYPLVICLVVYFFLFQVDSLISMYKDAAGIWYPDRYRPLITALLNLGLDLLLVRVWGLYGILLATAASLLTAGIPWLLHNVFRTLFPDQSPRAYAGDLLRLAGACCLGCWLSVKGASAIGGASWTALILKGAAAVLISNGVMAVLFCRRPEFRRLAGLVKAMVPGLSEKG